MPPIRAIVVLLVRSEETNHHDPAFIVHQSSTEREDLIRQAHDECQGDIQSRDVAIVKVADLPANSAAPNRGRLVSHHVRSPTQTVSSTGFDRYSKVLSVDRT